MTKPSIREHNIETNEVIDREMTDAEYAQHLKDIETNQKKAQLEAEKQAAKTAAEAKLAALGLTTDDLKALGLG